MEQAISTLQAAVTVPPAVAAFSPGKAPAEPVVRVRDLGKEFKIYPVRGGRLIEWLTLGSACRHEDFWALRHVSFELAAGESLGIIGVNGSGKSTLLKILSGAMYATEGSFDVRGRVLSLLELGTGLNPELTGRQNVINSARLLAFPPDYAQRRMEQIEAFAELGEFFDRPVRLYSNGMTLRLSFSMFACFDPEIFVIDEALSVGDVFFQQKCARRIQEMRQAGTTLLLVSHDLTAVEALCDRVLLLHGGVVKHDGDKKVGISLYYAMGGPSITVPAPATDHMRSHALRFTDDRDAEECNPEPGPFQWDELRWRQPDSRDAFGEGNVQIEGICFRRQGGGNDPLVEQGRWIEAFALLNATSEAPGCNAGIVIYDRMNRLLFARTWLNADIPPLDMKPGRRAVARFALRMDLEPGEYTVGFGVGQAIADPHSPTGWNQHVGAARYVELPHAAVVAVVPRPDRRRKSFGPANLLTRLCCELIDAPAAGASSHQS